MKKILIAICVIVLALVAGSFLRNSGDTPAPGNIQTQNTSGQTAPPTQAVSDTKPQPPSVTDDIAAAINAEATNEAQTASELEVDSSSFDAEIIEAGNIENAYEANNF